MSQAEQLFHLQEIDSDIRDKKNRLTNVIQAQKETDALLAARVRAETAASDLVEWQTKRRDLNLELQSLNDKTKRSEQRLYSGNVKNPKELADLQHEIDSLSRRRDALEEEILEVMIMTEDAETEKTAADEAHATIRSKWEKSQVGYKAEQNELALALHQLLGKRKEQLPLITPASLAEYESLSRRKNGVAVAKLRANMCLGCRMTVSAQTDREAREGKLVYCDTCGRIIVPA
jgi:predicted  nucleic acid-binding Zn-ribbon protein